MPRQGIHVVIKVKTFWCWLRKKTSQSGLITFHFGHCWPSTIFLHVNKISTLLSRLQSNSCYNFRRHISEGNVDSFKWWLVVGATSATTRSTLLIRFLMEKKSTCAFSFQTGIWLQDPFLPDTFLALLPPMAPNLCSSIHTRTDRLQSYLLLIEGHIPSASPSEFGNPKWANCSPEVEEIIDSSNLQHGRFLGADSSALRLCLQSLDRTSRKPTLTASISMHWISWVKENQANGRPRRAAEWKFLAALKVSGAWL